MYLHQTGLDPVPLFGDKLGHNLLPAVHIPDLRQALNAISDYSRNISKDKSQPMHARALAFWSLGLADAILDDLKRGKIDLEDILTSALELGMHYQRLLMCVHEESALRGKKVVAGAKKKRGPRAGSVWSVLESNVPGWMEVRVSRLVPKVRKHIPGMSAEAIRVEISRIKRKLKKAVH
jgi:hypothetical protein